MIDFLNARVGIAPLLLVALQATAQAGVTLSTPSEYIAVAPGESTEMSLTITHSGADTAEGFSLDAYPLFYTYEQAASSDCQLSKPYADSSTLRLQVPALTGETQAVCTISVTRPENAINNDIFSWWPSNQDYGLVNMVLGSFVDIGIQVDTLSRTVTREGLTQSIVQLTAEHREGVSVAPFSLETCAGEALPFTLDTDLDGGCPSAGSNTCQFMMWGTSIAMPAIASGDTQSCLVRLTAVEAGQSTTSLLFNSGDFHSTAGGWIADTELENNAVSLVLESSPVAGPITLPTPEPPLPEPVPAAQPGPRFAPSAFKDAYYLKHEDRL